MLSMLISDSRFDLVWFRLSCDHGWIRSGSVNVRKQQQQQQPCCFPFDMFLEGRGGGGVMLYFGAREVEWRKSTSEACRTTVSEASRDG